MFALGVFVSPLPYAVVVAFYAVYLLLVHVNDSHDKQELLAEDSCKHILIDDNSLAPGSQDTFFIAKSQFKDTKIFPSSDGLFTSADIPAIDTGICDDLPVVQYNLRQFLIVTQISARPPPTV